jgi:hypothetical protein
VQQYTYIAVEVSLTCGTPVSVVFDGQQYLAHSSVSFRRLYVSSILRMKGK